MPEIIGILINVFFVLLNIVIFVGIGIRIIKKRKAISVIYVPEKQETVSATVLNKQFFYKKIVQKNAPSYNKPQFVISFKTDDKTLHFDVGPDEFDSYKINQKGTLAYKGDILISFIPEGERIS